MTRFCGPVGYLITEETSPSVWTENLIEIVYIGDSLRLTNRWTPADKLNDDIAISNKISIVADPFAFEHFHNIKYVKWLGICWKVTSVSVEYPRLILEIGGEYNGEQAQTGCRAACSGG